MVSARHDTPPRDPVAFHAHAAKQALVALDQWGWAHGWRGSDPYDGLNTSRLLTPLKRYRRGRQALIQLVKRSPLDLRPLLGIHPADDSAALAWVLSAYSIVDFRDAADQKRDRDTLFERMLSMRTSGWVEPCWSYHFDMQSRVLFYPKNHPNAIATTFVGNALLDFYQRTAVARALEVAEGVATFLARHIPQTEDPPGAYFGYLVGDRSPIHNSNMLVSAFLARVAAERDRPEWHAAARRGLEWTIRRQRPDGSWPYGERPTLGWVDGFHTGYVLDALRVCADLGLGDAVEEAWLRALDYYRRNLFLSDGRPRYYADSTFPIDLQCVAQALQTFSIAAAYDRSYLQDARRVLAWTQRAMRGDAGAYFFQRRRLWVNHTLHMRGGNADMLLGLARLLRAELEAQAT
jgi:hypothetical protein